MKQNTVSFMDFFFVSGKNENRKTKRRSSRSSTRPEHNNSRLHHRFGIEARHPPNFDENHSRRYATRQHPPLQSARERRAPQSGRHHGRLQLELRTRENHRRNLRLQYG